MKLLEDSPSAEIREPHSGKGAKIALSSGVLVLVIGAIVGALLVTSGGNDPATDPSAGGDTTAEVELATWVDGASQACAQAARSDGVLAGGSDARHSTDNAADVDKAVRKLVGKVRALPLPTKLEDQEQAGLVVVLGDEADQAWAALSPDAGGSDIDGAADSTDAFIASLVKIGADCSALS